MSSCDNDSSIAMTWDTARHEKAISAIKIHGTADMALP